MRDGDQKEATVPQDAITSVTPEGTGEHVLGTKDDTLNFLWMAGLALEAKAADGLLPQQRGVPLAAAPHRLPQLEPATAE